jgi:hypothetical protein
MSNLDLSLAQVVPSSAQDEKENMEWELLRIADADCQ